MTLPLALRPIILAALLAAATPARAAVDPPEIHAIVIGWNGGNAELAPLHHADDDAVRLTMLFRGLDAPGAGRVRLYTEIDADSRATLGRAGLTVAPDGRPTREAVLGAFAALARQLEAAPAMSRRRILYVAYAGHGLEGRVLLAPTAGTEAGLTGAELRAALLPVAAAAPDLEILVFLDACRAQSLFQTRGDAFGPDLGAAIAQAERRSAALRLGVLTAARSGRPAGEVRRLGAGFFSHVLASGLAGGADADGDDLVTFGELAAFVALHTQKLTGQMPWFAPPGGDLGAGVVDHRGRRGRLLIPAGDSGRFVVGAPGGLPVFAEAFKSAGRPLRLALPPGRYRVERGGSEAAFDIGADRPVDLAGVTWSARAAVTSRGEPGEPAFSAPFSPEVVSTLAAGFHAGREPSSGPGEVVHELGVGVGIGGAPLALPGAERRLDIGYRLHLGALFVGAALLATSSAQMTDRGSYTLRRFEGGPQVGASAVFGRLELSAHVTGGWSSLLRSADGPTSGDLAAPFAALGARVGWRLLQGRWLVALAGRGGWFWARVDGDRRASFDRALGFSLGRRFR